MASSLIKRGFSLVLIKTPLVTCLTTYSYQYYCGKYIIWYQTATSLFSLNPSFKTSYFSLLLIDSTFLRNRNVRPPKVRRYWNLIFDFYEHKKTVYIIMYRYKITNKENVDLLNQVLKYWTIVRLIISYQFQFTGHKQKSFQLIT